MNRYAAAVLELALGDARRRHASEIRFMSGMFPALVIEEHLRLLDGGSDLRLDTVRSIHQECLSLAGRPELVSRARASYKFVSPKFGRYTCKYELRDNIASLTSRRHWSGVEELSLVPPRRAVARNLSRPVG